MHSSSPSKTAASAQGEAPSARRAAGLTFFRIAALLLAVSAAPLVPADIISVNAAGTGDYPTIQAAITAANPGDVVELANGMYTGTGNKNLDFGGKAITVRSASGDPALCIINCQGSGRGFYFHSGEGANSIVDGLAITDGYVEYDPGGGGMHITGASPVLTNCTITGNRAGPGSYGGGVYISSGSPTLTNCRINTNSIDSEDWFVLGAGIFCSDSSPLLTDCTISGNEGTIYTVGGGVWCTLGSPTLINCTITENVSGGGAGVACSGNTTLTNCEISGNTVISGGGGGGVLCVGDGIVLTNCTISANTAGIGGGVRCDASSPTLTNCTISGNSADNGGGGLRCDTGSPTLTNCVLWGDAPDEIYVNPGTPVVTYSLVQGGTGQPWFGTGCIDTDPHFVDPDGPDDDPDTWWDNDFRLVQTSLCIDAGDNASVPADTLDLDDDEDTTEPLPWDSDGAPRFVDVPCTADAGNGTPPVVDMGAYEFQVRTLHVPSEYATIQAAIDAAGWCDIVEIADGTYTGTGNKDLDFGGKVITVRSVSNDPALCIIDCEDNGRGFHFHSGEGPDSVVQGLTITNGHVDSGSGGGGGVYCSFSDPTLTNCVISRNTADDGGGVYCYFSFPTLTDCQIAENSTSNRGGGVNCEGSNPTLTNCAITGNSSVQHGGGVCCNDTTYPTLTNCIIADNSSIDGRGGGVWCGFESNATLATCTITGNTAGIAGGGIYCDLSSPTLTNCILWNDAPDEIGSSPAGPVVRYSLVQGGAGEPWFGTGCIDADPRFVDPNGPDNDPNTWQDNDFRLLAFSPCIDAGDNASVPADTLDLDGDGDTAEATPWDLDQAPRFVDDPGMADTGNGTPPIVDMGAYEFQEQSDTLSVPSEYPTIQAAIDAAGPGDAVEIADGTYTGTGNKNLDFHGKTITVRSASGDPALCIIDCEGVGCGFVFDDGEDCSASVEGLTITHGSGHDPGGGYRYGGAIYCANSTPTISKCVLSDNSALYGGGICCQINSSPTLTHCVINVNHASYGAGICCRDSGLKTTNCLISNNLGQGLYCENSHTVVCTNCTIIRNRDYWGIFIDVDESATISNCIIWGHAEAIRAIGPVVPVVAYSNIEGGYEEPWFGTGCIESNPLLTPDGHLTINSPCVDSGEPTGVYTGQVDIDGEPRIENGRVDMGSDEWRDSDGDGLPDWWESRHFGAPTAGDPVANEDDDGRLNLDEYNSGTNPLEGPRVFYVGLVGNDGWDGLAPVWNGVHGPKLTIQAAIEASHPYEGDRVEIADGTYTGPGNRDLDFRGRAIEVGSAGGNPNACIIDCEDEGRGFYFHYGEDPGSVVRDLTITHGRADESAPGGSSGGAIHCLGASSPTLTNCMIHDSTADGAGGGVCCAIGCDSILTNCVLSGNSAEGGGGMSSWQSSPTLNDCMLISNSALVGGGVDSGDIMLINCKISGNVAQLGGGISCIGEATVANCVISANSAEYRGGGLYIYSECYGTLTNCTIVGNSAPSGGGGSYLCTAGVSTTNCVFWNNTPEQIGLDPLIYGDWLPYFCDIQGGLGEPWFTSTCIDSDPLFWDPDGPDGNPETWEDNDYSLATGSPCIDAGNSNTVPPDTPDLDDDGNTAEPLPFDLSGSPRFAEDPNTADSGSGTPPIADMGAYEYRVPGDVDGDGDVDDEDLATLTPCLAGPLAPVSGTCRPTDLDGDDDCDMEDFAALQVGFEGGSP